MKTDRETLKEIALDHIVFKTCGYRWLHMSQIGTVLEALTKGGREMYDTFSGKGEVEVASEIHMLLKEKPEMATVRELARHYSLRDFLASLKRKGFKSV